MKTTTTLAAIALAALRGCEEKVSPAASRI
jgi:hypothetical protein